jgi:molybdenum cofactor biosynthesis enzyme MoaA
MGTSRTFQKVIEGKTYLYNQDLDVISSAPCGNNSIYERTRVASAVDLCLEITTSCNMACKNCFSCSSYDVLGHNLPIDQIRSSIENRRHQIIRVCITGGEPTMHPEIDSILRLPDRFDDCSFVISTNGTFRQGIENLFVDKKWLVAISLHGSKESHNSYTRSKSFDCAVRRIRTLSSRTVVHIYTVLHNDITDRDLDWLFKLRDEAGAAFLRLIVPRPFGRYEILHNTRILERAQNMVDDRSGIKTSRSLTKFISVNCEERFSS